MASPTIHPPTPLTIHDVMGRLERGEPIQFLDARNPRAWSESETKLPGALRTPADEVDRHLGELPHDRTLITYCT
jgi:rhodanese-related sulfurtransferase